MFYNNFLTRLDNQAFCGVCELSVYVGEKVEIVVLRGIMFLVIDVIEKLF